MTYAANPADVTTTITIIKKLEGGLNLANQHQNTYTLEEKVIQLSEQLLAMQGQSVKVLTYQPSQKKNQWQAKSGAKQGFICFNY